MSEIVTLCGHCGTEVQSGFTVCKACGANYRGNHNLINGGIGLVAFGVFIFLIAGDRLMALVLTGPICLLGALAIIRGASVKHWYRKND